MKKRIFIIIIIVLLILAGLFAIDLKQIQFYETHYLKNTYINDINVGNTTIDEAKKLLEKDVKEYSLTIKNNEDVIEIINGKDFDYQKEINKDELQKNMNNQKKWQWLLSNDYIYEIEFEKTYDKDKLKECVKNLDAVKNGEEPKNAYIEKTTEGYRIVKEENGSIIDVEKLSTAVLNSVDKEDKELIINDDYYFKAEITENDKDLKSFMEIAEKLNNLIITYDFKDRQEIINYELLYDIVDINYNKELIINENKIKEYVVKLAEKYDTYNKTRTFKTTNNVEVKVPAGIYGWQIDINKTVEQLLETIKSLENKTVEPIYKTKALDRSTNDIGDTYVEVSLKDQYLWFYKEGELIVESDIVSGLANTSRETPTGVFKIWSRETNRYLTGATYRSWVNYWMPITWDGVGLHDALWQSSFGGDRYKTHGSHGCINLPLDIAKTIYENSYTGIPVIVYK